MAENLGTLGTAFIDIVAGTDRVESQMAGLQRTVRGVAAAIGVTIGAAGVIKVFKDIVGAASDFESSFAGIRKTLDASDAEFQAMSDGMRQLAKEIPVPVNELNKIGETAGQLGIAKEGVLEFTRVIAAMSVATNLSSDAAATGMAKLANIMGDSESDFDRMGSAINELGAAGSATESDILNMSIRFATAGKLIGLSTPQVLGFAAAMVGVGVESEAGGTALSKTFTDIQTAVATGSKELSLFAKIALPESNDAVREFSTLFRKDAAAAITLFVDGLKKLDNEDAIVALTNLGIAEVRQRNALLALSEATVGIGDSLKVSARGYQENTSLMTELEKRTQTFDSQMQLLRSSLNDLAISAGNALLPTLKSIVSTTSEFLDQASRGEGPINGLAVAVAALGVAFASVKIAALVQSFIALGTVTAGGGALAGLGVGLANAATATFSLRTAALAAGPALMALAPAALIAALAAAAYQVGNLYGKIKELHTAEGNLAVSEENARQQTILLAQAIKDKYGVAISGADKSLEQWRAELHEFARTADPANNKTVQLAEAARAKAEADRIAKERAVQLTEEQKKLNATFLSALKPADDLNKELDGLAKTFTAADKVGVYGDQIIAAAEAQRQHGYAVKGTVAELEPQALALRANREEAAAAAEFMKNLDAEVKRVKDSFEATSEAWLRLIAPEDDLGDVLKASAKARKPEEDRLKAMDATVGARASDNETEAREQIRQTTAAVHQMFEEGKTASEVLARLGPDIDRAAASSSRFHVELNPTVDALIRHRDQLEANEKAIKDFDRATEQAAQQWRDFWSGAMVDIAGSVQQGLSRLGADSVKTIFGDIGKNAGSVFMDAFQVQLQAPMNNLFAEWGAKLSGHLSKALGGISGKLSSALGGGLLGDLAGAGLGMAISGALSLASNLFGKGKRTANEFVGEVENPFGAELDKLVSSFNRANTEGSLSLKEAKDARAAINELIASFVKASNEFAAQGDTQAKVVSQSQAHMEELFGPGFQNILGGLDSVITDLSTGATIFKEEIEEALLAQMQLESRFQSALKPADELNEELTKLAGHSQADLVSVYGREILAAAQAQREHGFDITGMVAALEPLAMATSQLADVATKWQPRVASQITPEQQAALGIISANQSNAAAAAAAMAAAAPRVAAMNIPETGVARSASQIFSDAVYRFVPAVDKLMGGGAGLGGTIQVNLSPTIVNTFELPDGSDPLIVRDKVMPEITQVLITGIRGFREQWTQLFRDTQQGVTATAIPTTA